MNVIDKLYDRLLYLSNHGQTDSREYVGAILTLRRLQAKEASEVGSSAACEGSSRSSKGGLGDLFGFFGAMGKEFRKYECLFRDLK